MRGRDAFNLFMFAFGFLVGQMSAMRGWWVFAFEDFAGAAVFAVILSKTWGR